MPGFLAAIAASNRPRITIADATVSDTPSAGINANARYKLEADGDIIKTLVAGGATDLGDWIVPKGSAGGNYEAKVTVTSGSLSSGTAGSNLALSSDREWGLVRTTVGLSTCIFTLEIYLAGGGPLLASKTITLEAEKT